MIIIALTDIHGDVSAIDSLAGELAAADVVLLTGDLTHFGGEQAALQVLDAVRTHAQTVLAVPGNCDAPEAARVLEDEGVSLHRHGVVLGGIAFFGVGGSLPCPGKTPLEFSEDDFTRYLAEASARVPAGIPAVLVVHQPPLGTINDLAGNGRHVGSAAIREFIVACQPLLCCTGHIHEGVGCDAIGNTPIINPGAFRQRKYARAVIGEGVEALEICTVQLQNWKP